MSIDNKDEKVCKIPILFTIFNRKEVALEAFKSIHTYQPDKLYIAADGPRSAKKGEDIKCQETRKAVLDAIDWDCEIKTLMQNENLGCAYAMNEAITWFFSQEKYGIICEDDIVLSQDFYKICEILLPRYEHEDKVMEISAQNYTPEKNEANDFVFSNSMYCWGWASWSRAWRKMDMEMTFWPSLSIFDFCKNYGLFQGLYTYWRGLGAYKDLKLFSSWAFRWHLSIMNSKGLVMLPKTNLSKNIGVSIEGAHYANQDIDLYEHLSIGKMFFPLVFPQTICVSKKQLSAERRDFMRIKIFGLKKIIYSFLRKR